MTILSYFPHCNFPFRMGFYSAVTIWIIVSTFGFNLLKEGGFVKEVQCKQPPVYITYYKRQKGLRNGLNLHPLNYRLARPGILSKGSQKKRVSLRELVGAVAVTHILSLPPPLLQCLTHPT